MVFEVVKDTRRGYDPMGGYARLQQASAEQFAASYVVDHDPRKAALAAGLGPLSMQELRRLMKVEPFASEIKEAELRVMDDLGITPHRVLTKILGVMDSADKDSDKLKAAEMLGQRLGWNNRVQVEVSGDVAFELSLPALNGGGLVEAIEQAVEVEAWDVEDESASPVSGEPTGEGDG